MTRGRFFSEYAQNSSIIQMQSSTMTSSSVGPKYYLDPYQEYTIRCDCDTLKKKPEKCICQLYNSDGEYDPKLLEEQLQKEIQTNQEFKERITIQPGSEVKKSGFSRNIRRRSKPFSFQKVTKLFFYNRCYFFNKKKNVFREKEQQVKHEYIWKLPWRGWFKVNVEGSLKENKSGGYGVIIRDAFGETKVAAAGVFQPVTLVYHQLQGVVHGLELAKLWQVFYCSPGSNNAATYLSKLHKEIVYCSNDLPRELHAIVEEDRTKLHSEAEWKLNVEKYA